MRSHTSWLSILALSLAWRSGIAQNSTPIGVHENSGAAVRLEAHDRQTLFKIGDPVILDLVFTSRTPGYVVNIDTTPYLPVSDLVELEPQNGWVRSHSSFRGNGPNGSALEDLGTSPIRVPVLLNRTITFQEPGHYEVTLTTERLRTSDTVMHSTSLESCDPCRTTNAVGIDLSERDESEESALVVSLSRELEKTKSAASASELAPERKEELSHELDAELRTADTEEGNKQTEALLQKLNDMASNQLAAIQKQEDARREAAVRLAYLGSDDAVRAKVHFIDDAREDGGAIPSARSCGMAWLVHGTSNCNLPCWKQHGATRIGSRHRNCTPPFARRRNWCTNRGLPMRLRSGRERPRSDKRPLMSIRLRLTRSLPLYPCVLSQTGRRPSSI